MMLLWIASLLLGASAAWRVLGARRRLLSLDARCAAASAAVEAETTSLYAFLPALVGLMRAFAPQEREAIDVVSKAYASARRAQTPQARLFGETRLADGVHHLIVRAERVPQIEALDDFKELRERTEEAERRLAAARRELRAATEAYNEALGRFPERLFAMRSGFSPRAFYDIGLDEPAGSAPG